LELSRVPSLKLKRYAGRLASKFCEVQLPEDRDVVLQNPETRALIRNDGSQTILVHSTTNETAAKIMEQGLVMPRDWHDPERPVLRHTAIMLAGPEEGRLQHRMNTEALAYRYDGLHNNAKLVFAIPRQTPGTSRQQDSRSVGLNQFENTFLHEADGEIIRPLEGGDDEKAFVMSPKYAVGYIDLDTGIFQHNPGYDPQLPTEDQLEIQTHHN